MTRGITARHAMVVTMLSVGAGPMQLAKLAKMTPAEAGTIASRARRAEARSTAYNPRINLAEAGRKKSRARQTHPGKR